MEFSLFQHAVRETSQLRIGVPDLPHPSRRPGRRRGGRPMSAAMAAADHPDGSAAERQQAARDAYRSSLAGGVPLSGAELGRMCSGCRPGVPLGGIASPVQARSVGASTVVALPSHRRPHPVGGRRPDRMQPPPRTATDRSPARWLQRCAGRRARRRSRSRSRSSPRWRASTTGASWRSWPARAGGPGCSPSASTAW
jgi:hypothetical protein